MNPEKAKEEVAKFWFRQSNTELPIDQLVTVWFCYILGGWKTLLFSLNLPGVYFEVTFDVGQNQMYIDYYEKVKNEVIHVV